MSLRYMIKSLILLLGFLSFFFPGAFLQAQESRWAVIVGIDRYQSSNITPLAGAVADAKAMARALMQYSRFPENQVFLLTSDDPANRPDLGNIYARLQYVASRAKTGDTFLFYFSGHGISRGDESFLLTWESNIQIPDLVKRLSLPVEDLNDYLSRISASKVLIVMDACRNNPETGRGEGDNLLTESFARGIRPESISGRAGGISLSAKIYSCKIGQRSYEWPGRKRGFFSIALEEALSGKAQGEDGEVTLDRVESYMHRRVPELVEQALGPGKSQVPWVERSGAGAGEFVWSRFETPARPVEEYVTPKTPGQSDFSLEDIERKAAEIAAAKVAWADKLNEMRRSSSKVEEIEKLDLPSSDKADAWQRILDAYSEDNPYSAEDDRLRTRASERLRYWRDYRPPRQEVSEYYVPGSVREVAGVPGLRMVPIPAGTFKMGTNSTDHKWLERSRPVHAVTLSAFEMSATEITVGQFKQFVQASGYSTEAERGGGGFVYTGGKWEQKADANWRNTYLAQTDDHPVVMVSWNDAKAFCLWIGKQTGRRYDLPTEAEWEYACRAGTTTEYYTGNSEGSLSRAGWFGGNSGSGTHPVGQKEPNGFGLYDMHGNVWEWCSDWYGSYSSASQSNPTGPASGSSRVARGGGWGDDANGCRSAGRDGGDPGGGGSGIGFRVVCR